MSVRHPQPDSVTPLLRPVSGPSREPVSDAELVSRARSGDRWAEEAIFRRHVEAVMGLATRLLRSTAEADDVVQDTFTDALQRLSRLDDPSRLRSWLLGIAVHRAQRRLRSRTMLRFFGLASAEPTLSTLASDDASPEVLAELRRIDRLLQGATVAERIAWQLRRVEGHKLEEIAALTSSSLATVKRRIDAVQKRIDAAIAAGGDVDGRG